MQRLREVQTILVVEDSDDDFEMMMDALTGNGGINNPVVRCEDGREALDYLLHRGEFEDAALAPTPGIILLDLNLPGIDGRQVLTTIKSTPALRTIPVVVLTTSDDERDVQACYALGANTYVRKPVDLGTFIAAVRRLKEYWLELALLPKEESQ
jgi:two-component system response regulator